MMNSMIRLMAVPLLMGLVALCAAATAASSEDIAEVVAGNSRFALDLYRQLADSSEGNLFMSPYSVSTALAMTYAGARGNTAVQMADVLQFTLPADDLHSAFGELIGQINDPAREGYTLSVANRLWGQRDYPFLPEFLNTVEENYGAGLERLNFIGAPEASRSAINEWVEDQTNDKIRDLLPYGSITSDTRLVLTNAIYFLGDWQYQFDPELTAEGSFFVTPQESITLPMMHQEASLRYGEYEGVQVLELPYNNEELSLVALLPDEIDGLAALEASLTPETLDDYLGQLTTRDVSVRLPKFEMTSEFSLSDTLATLGMTDAFDPASADFSGITGGRDLYISMVVHKAFIQLDEEGTEAAGATGVIAPTGDPNPEFHADHPFCFLIRDNLTDSILFLGRVVEPEASRIDTELTTLVGDLNGDDIVGGDDLDIVRGSWGQSVDPGCLLCGDPSGDGLVGSADLDIVRADWGASAPAVPEPSTFVLLLVGAVFAAFRRRR